jgi:hypothetical protein
MNKYIILFLMLICAAANAAAPKVGRTAAAKYFQAKGGTPADYSEIQQPPRYPSSIESLSSEDHYLAFGFATSTQSDSYNWGQSIKEDDVAQFGIDMTYRLTQEGSLFDQAMRLSYSAFKPAGQRASKLSFMYAMTLPDAGAKFPLYFGLALGPGVFLKQLPDESPISFDYQLFLGLRLFNIFEKTGFYIEGGMRNHLLLTSDGQLNGTFVSAGAVFTF